MNAATSLAFAALFLFIALSLHGCGSHGKADTTTSTSTTITNTTTTTNTSTSTSTTNTSTTSTTTTTTLQPDPPGPLPWCKQRVRNILSAIADRHAQNYKVPVGIGVAGRVAGDDPRGCVADAVGFPSGWMTDDEAEGGPAADAFLMGSFTKMWTASAVMKLFEDGKIDLDVPAYKYFEKAYQQETGGSTPLESNFGPNIRIVTTRDLLNMRGGIADYDELAYQAQHPTEDLGPGRSAELFGQSIGGVQPGDCGVYSSMSYVLLGLILVQASGVNHWYEYDQNVWRNYFPDIRFGTRGPCSSYTRIKGHCSLCDAKGLSTSSMSCTGGFSCGNMIARPRDAAAFTYSLFRGKLLKLSTVSNMTGYQDLGAPGATKGDSCTSWNQGSLYGLGVQAPAYGVSASPVTAKPGHAGVTYGFMSLTAFDRVKDLSISAVAANDAMAPTPIFQDAYSQLATLPMDQDDVVV